MKILMLNQKSAMKYNDIAEYIENLKSLNNKFIIIPSSLYIKEFKDAGYTVGIQNIAKKDEKNQTGEITASQAVSTGVTHVIIGHSERRANQNETSDILFDKFEEAIKNDLTVIFCVGENLVDYKLKNTDKVIYEQLDGVFKNVDKSKLTNIYIAYEPCWAIGTGMVPTNFEISKVASLIKKYFENIDSNIKVLYGGSVNETNISNLNEVENIDGFLVGGASNDYKKVIEMVNIID